MREKIKKIAFIGLGKMGTAMAKKLLEAGFDLIVYNRTASKTKVLVDMGAHAANSVQEAVTNVDLVITSLLDDKAVIEVTTNKNGILTSLKAGAIHIGTSTVLPATSKELTELHQQKNSIYIAGNVLGVPSVAEKGALTSIIAGDEAIIAHCESVFKAYSNNLLIVGKEPYKANVMKISTNYLLAATIECMGEIYTFAEKSGLAADYVHGMLHTVFAHPAFKLYADKIKNRDFDNVNFDVKGGFKDLNLFQQAFAEVNVVSDIANIIKDKFIIALAHGMQEKDWSAVTDVTRLLANLK